MTVAAVATVVISLWRGKHFLFDRKSPRQLSVPLESGYFAGRTITSPSSSPSYYIIEPYFSAYVRSPPLHPLSSAHSPPPAGLPQQLKSVSLSFLFFSCPFVNAILPLLLFSSSLSISLIFTIILFVPFSATHFPSVA